MLFCTVVTQPSLCIQCFLTPDTRHSILSELFQSSVQLLTVTTLSPSLPSKDEWYSCLVDPTRLNWGKSFIFFLINHKFDSFATRYYYYHEKAKMLNIIFFITTAVAVIAMAYGKCIEQNFLSNYAKISMLFKQVSSMKLRSTLGRILKDAMSASFFRMVKANITFPWTKKLFRPMAFIL